ncbi:hypothetical protein RUM44_003284 [Polyplax serrata]|uniref:Uncharacterized protein n=1 Tax=Polyplax serrata TaxID=468196 RepID=A0ABR1AHL1_POLSC
MRQYDGDTTKGNKDGKHAEERKGKDAEEKRPEDVNHLVLHSSVVDVRLLIPKPLKTWVSVVIGDTQGNPKRTSEDPKGPRGTSWDP